MKRRKGNPDAGGNRAGAKGPEDINDGPYNANRPRRLAVELSDKPGVDNCDFTPPKPNPLLDAVYPQLPLRQMLQIPCIFALNDDCWAKLSLEPKCKVTAALEHVCQEFADEHNEAYVI